ncbi:MAG TPA: GNAT family N-acetyltransferase [Solirubrobacteraceae bacterium]|jgi:RimJ/RimL family protein N-acetyltransferase|nr:GNAT family N-acetyltransferase [Solirubrobacteraceae bacterium]
MNLPELRTARLLLRRWRAEDLGEFAAINGDPVVMEYFPETLTREQTAEMIERMEAGFERDGYGFWAVEVSETGSLAGFVGLNPVSKAMPFAPAVEAGWRLGREHWGHGIAREAAEAALDHGFGPLGLDEIVAFTTVGNLPSRRLMERLGMRHDESADFDHPGLATGHPLTPHVVYRLSRES